MPPPTFYEFFAGGGMVRAALTPRWRCAFANDIDPKKAASYRANWGDGEMVLHDVAAVRARDLPGRADLMWGSFPCQDLSVAGPSVGLSGKRSRAFFPFRDLLLQLRGEARAPRLVAIENVRGALTADRGRGFAAICQAFAEAGYRFGALMIDAALFTPQSRPRLFIVGVDASARIDPRLVAVRPEPPFHTSALAAAVDALSAPTRSSAIWWRVPEPASRAQRFGDLLESDVPPKAWRAPEQTRALLNLMAPIHRAKVEALRSVGASAVGTVYRRTRRGADGAKAQRAEVRFDGLAGCLRTPGGGSSRQTLLVIEDGAVRSRLLTPRETARLMGLPDDYLLPSRPNDAYHLTGDGVVVPVVAHLTRHLFEPLLADFGQEALDKATMGSVRSIQA